MKPRLSPMYALLVAAIEQRDQRGADTIRRVFIAAAERRFEAEGVPNELSASEAMENAAKVLRELGEL